jgi:hypothetical protein
MIGEEIQMTNWFSSFLIANVLPEQGFAIIQEQKITAKMMKQCTCLESKRSLDSFMAYLLFLSPSFSAPHPLNQAAYCQAYQTVPSCLYLFTFSTTFTTKSSFLSSDIPTQPCSIKLSPIFKTDHKKNWQGQASQLNLAEIDFSRC